MVSIAFGKHKNLQAGFKTKLIAVTGRLGCDPSHLMAAMAFETGEKFSADVRNLVSGATGLIQFMPKTAKGLGTSTDVLAAMTAVEQLDVVERYFQPFIGRLNTLSDVYMAILWPAAVGKPAAHVLFASPRMAYEQNKGLDANKDGVVTKDEAAAKVHAKLVRGLSEPFLG